MKATKTQPEYTFLGIKYIPLYHEVRRAELVQEPRVGLFLSKQSVFFFYQNDVTVVLGVNSKSPQCNFKGIWIKFDFPQGKLSADK